MQSLVLAGFHHISFEEAEELKKERITEKNRTIIKPVVQKMASIVNRFVIGYDVDVIYVVGGACVFNDFEKIFEDETGIKTIKPVEPLLVTPLGIAFNCQR